jgi:hypothetical protein
MWPPSRPATAARFTECHSGPQPQPNPDRDLQVSPTKKLKFENEVRTCDTKAQRLTLLTSFLFMEARLDGKLCPCQLGHNLTRCFCLRSPSASLFSAIAVSLQGTFNIFDKRPMGVASGPVTTNRGPTQASSLIDDLKGCKTQHWSPSL